MTLRAEFDWGSNDPSEAKYAAEVKLVEQLNDQPDSVLYKRIMLSEEAKSAEAKSDLALPPERGTQTHESLSNSAARAS